MNKVLPGLFVGNYRDSKDTVQLERHKISHIVAIHDAARRIHQDKEYLCIMASDTPYQNLSQYFPTCNDFIHQARTQGGNVLIHCLAGMSRSVTIAVAYIMSITTLQLSESQKVLRGARPVSCPNSGFLKQLQDFETSKLFEERRRLLEKFPGTTFLECDEDYCKRLLVSYNNLLLSRRICEGRCACVRSCPTGLCRARLARLQSSESVTARISNTASPSSSPAKHKSPVITRVVSCPNTPLKSIREKSSSNNNNNNSTSTPSPRRRRRLPEIASTTTVSSSSSSSPAKYSATNWERHYGCLNTTLLRNRANNLITQELHSSSRSGSPSLSSVSVSSTPASPIHYARAGGARRADSVTSIGSVTSVMSLPAHCMTTATTSISSIKESGSRRSNSPMPFTTTTSAITSSHSSSPRHYVSNSATTASPLSCPPTPRRRPTVTRRTLPSSPIMLATSTSHGLSHSHSLSHSTRSPRRTMTTPLAVMDDFDETLTVVIEPRKSPTTCSTSSGSRDQGGSSNTIMSSSPTVTTSGINTSCSSSSNNMSSSWAISPASYLMSNNHKKSSSAPEIVVSQREPMVRPPQSGITRWVMKRSAYRYTMENSYK